MKGSDIQFQIFPTWEISKIFRQKVKNKATYQWRRWGKKPLYTHSTVENYTGAHYQVEIKTAIPFLTWEQVIAGGLVTSEQEGQ